MQYTLMHRNILVEELLIDETVTSIQQILSVYDARHFPLAAFCADYLDEKNRRLLNN